MIVYFGCYTDEAHQKGLSVMELDERSGAMSVCAEYPVSNALYQAFSPDKKYFYSCTGEGLASFATSTLEMVDNVKLGNCICHVASMQDGKRVTFADYLGGFAGSVEVENGRFGNVVKHRHSGGGPNLPRQDKAHCHQAVPLPDGKGYCVVDLGLDELVEYPLGRVFHTSPMGAGPRHLLFHPNGRLAFLVYELGCLVSSLSWSSTEGFKQLNTWSTLSCPHATTTPHSSSLAAAIRFSPDMHGIVVSNRGENSLVVYDFDESTGKMSFRSRTLLAGDWPRDFKFVDNELALVACERSGEILAMRYDSESSVFSQIGAIHGLYRPVSLMD